MMDRDRRAAVAAYKERKTVAGLYAVRCAASGDTWVGAAPDLATIRNRLWFQLRFGSSPHKDLQAAWNAHGADGLTFEVLEPLDEEMPAYALRAALRERAAHWCRTLAAKPL